MYFSTTRFNVIPVEKTIILSTRRRPSPRLDSPHARRTSILSAADSSSTKVYIIHLLKSDPPHVSLLLESDVNNKNIVIYIFYLLKQLVVRTKNAVVNQLSRHLSPIIFLLRKSRTNVGILKNYLGKINSSSTTVSRRNGWCGEGGLLMIEKYRRIRAKCEFFFL